MCDLECAKKGSPDSFVENISNQHRRNPTFIRPTEANASTFTIRHYAGTVTYNASSFLDCNRDVIPNDVLSLFSKSSCNSDFVTLLFRAETEALNATGGNPKVGNSRISPLASYAGNTDDSMSTLTQDFHVRVDELVKKLVKAKPQFIQCIKTNNQEQAGLFDRHCVMKQLRDLQVLETVNLMASGYAHRIKFSAFNRRYRLLAPFKSLERTDVKAVLDCQLILEYFTEALKNVKLSNAAVNWSLGNNHIFLSENARQQLERFREQRRQTAARLIQGAFRNYTRRKRAGLLRKPLPKVRTEVSKSVANGSCSVNHSPIALNSWTGSLKRNTNLRNGAASQASRFLNSSQATTMPVTRSLNQSAHSVNLNMSSQSCFTQPPTQQHPIASARTATLTKTGTLTKLQGRPRPQPISGTPPPDSNERCDQRLIQQTCALFGLDLERPPPVPPSRTYTVTGNAKLAYPQARVLKMNYSDGSGTKLLRGETVMVIASSQKRGSLVVECRGQTFHVPYQYLELKPDVLSPPPVNSLMNTTLISD